MTTHRLVLAGVLVSLGAVTPALLAQNRAVPQTSAVPTDTSAALLAEVRALRADLAQTSRVSLRAQLLVARVQLQEQRIIYFDRKRAETSARLAAASERARTTAADLAQLEEHLSTVNREGSQIIQKVGATDHAAMLRQLEINADHARREAQAATAAEQQLRTEEAQVVSDLSAEQGRWSDFSKRLEELERGLK